MFTSLIALDWDNKMVMNSVNMTTKKSSMWVHISIQWYSPLQAECHWKSHRFLVNNNERKSWENVLSNLTRLLIWRPRNLVLIDRKIKTFLPSSKRPHRHCIPPSLLFSGYRGNFHRVWSGRNMKITIQPHLLSNYRMRELYSPLSTRLNVTHKDKSSRINLQVFPFVHSR